MRQTTSITKEKLITYSIGAFWIAFFSLIPIGAFMAIYTDDTRWLALCFPLIFLLS